MARHGVLGIVPGGCSSLPICIRSTGQVSTSRVTNLCVEVQLLGWLVSDAQRRRRRPPYMQGCTILVVRGSGCPGLNFVADGWNPENHYFRPSPIVHVSVFRKVLT